MGRGRATVVALLAFQGAMVALWLPVEPRSLCGLHYAAALLFALDAPQRLHDALVREKVTGWIALLLLGPWTVLGAAHASDYAGVATGQEEPSGWYSAHVPLHDAWTGLDSALPEDAALLLWEPWIARKLGAAYAPRPLYLHADDVPADLQRPLYFIWLGTHLEAAIRFHVKTLPGRRRTLGEQVWSTEDALWRTHRETQQGRMRVWKLEPAAPPPETSATEAAPQAPPQAAPAP